LTALPTDLKVIHNPYLALGFQGLALRGSKKLNRGKEFSEIVSLSKAPVIVRVTE
jgi:hypothetical protein